MHDNAEKIVDILSPVIGPGLARSAVNMQCRKMQILPENLSGDLLIEFADRFRVPLQYFAGESVANTVVDQIKALRDGHP